MPAIPAKYPAGSVFYLYTPNLDHLSNDAENFGGLMTEVRSSIRSAAMRAMNMKKAISKTQLLLALMVAVALLLAAAAYAAAPGITGPTFNLTAQAGLHQPARRRDASTPGATAATAAPSGFRPGARSPSAILPHHAGSWADPDRHGRTDRHGT